MRRKHSVRTRDHLHRLRLARLQIAGRRNLAEVMMNKKVFAITVGLVAVCGLALVLIASGPAGAGSRFPWLRTDGTGGTAESGMHSFGGEKSGSAGSSSRANSGPQLISMSAVPWGGETARPERDSGINFGTYLKYLDSLGRKLTPAEEDAILANSNRDPQVLLGLAMAGSSRGAAFLREALEKAPENPLVHYEILHRGDPGFDRLASAQKLVSLVPNDAELWYAAAAEALAVGNRTLATDYLRNAAAQPDFGSLYNAELAARIEAYQWAGSTEEMAQAKAFLENRPSIGDVALTKLQQYLLTESDSAGPFEMTQGKEEMAAILLNGLEKSANSKGLTLGGYYVARAMEIEFLRSFFEANVTGGNPAAAKYLTAPASQLLSEASAAFEDLQPVLMFSYDKPGIYQRLSGDQQQELIERIRKDGEVSAFQWAYQERPDIFHSPDFKPQGYSKKMWAEYLSHVGTAPGAIQKR